MIYHPISLFFILLGLAIMYPAVSVVTTALSGTPITEKEMPRFKLRYYFIIGIIVQIIGFAIL